MNAKGQGRKPVPLNMRLVQGNPSGEKIPDDIPDPPVVTTIPDPPETLSKPAQKHWVEFAEQLSNMRVLTAADYPALIMLCEAYANYWKAQRGIRKHGIVRKSANGLMTQSHHCLLADKFQTQVLKLLMEFGMTPSSRMKVRSQ